MYAIVNIAGQQFKVQKDQQIFVHRLPNKEGEEVVFEEVLLIDNDGKVDVGAPAVSGAKVTAKVLEHLKGDKVIVFKKKRRKGYQKSNGHRQYLTKISIGGIAIGAPKKAASKAAAKASDDLTKIEGVGPKIAEVLANAGMNTFAAVAGSTAEEIKALLEAAGSKFAAHDPATWPQQAAMAAEGKWDELKAWQDELKGGKES
jgi:large subunit ribosomal protein L21